MSTDVGVLRGVSWRDCCPWLVLTNTVRLATSTQLVVLAFVGVVMVSIGWQLCGAVFLPANVAETDPAISLTHQWLARWPGGQGPAAGLARATGLPQGETAPFDPVLDVPFRMAEPLRRVLDPTISWTNLGYYLAGGLWTVAVWALFGGAITRTAVVRLGIEERVGLRESLKFAGRKWPALFAAPVLPLIGIALLACPMLVLGLLMRADVGVVLAAPLWLLVLLAGFVMAILAIGLLFGWPLMWATIGAESSDAFDAISRSYAYTFQRPLHYFFYVLVAALLGSLGWLLLWGFTESIITLSYWGTSWGTGAVRLAEIVAATGPDPAADSTAPAPSATLWLGSALIGLCVGIVRAVASGVSFSYFWCVAAAVYLLLRRDTDQTEMDDIVVEDEEDIPYGLPPLETDAEGVPGVSSEEVDDASAGSVADHVP